MTGFLEQSEAGGSPLLQNSTPFWQVRNGRGPVYWRLFESARLPPAASPAQCPGPSEGASGAFWLLDPQILGRADHPDGGSKKKRDLAKGIIKVRIV